MTTAALIQRLTSTGIHLSAEGDRLHVEAPPDTLTAELRELLTNRKADLIEAMSGTRGHLLELAESEGIAQALVHRLPTADVDACTGLPDATLAAYLYALKDTAEREAGRRPASYTARAMCRHCGPVWLPSDVLQGAPMISGWPQVLGCPWCHVHGYVPRPAVTSATCQHYQPDAINPPAGMGRCQCGQYFPAEHHPCPQYQPKGVTP